MKIELVNNSTSECNETAIISVAKFALVESGIHPDSELSIQVVTEEVMSDLHMKWMRFLGSRSLKLLSAWHTQMKRS